MSGLTREEVEEIWSQMDAAGQAAKDPQRATLQLKDFYRRLDAEDRAVADAVIIDWVGADDGGKRYDAIALIRQFNIRAALQALRAYLVRLGASDDPLAPYQHATLQRIITDLEGGESHL